MRCSSKLNSLWLIPALVLGIVLGQLTPPLWKSGLIAFAGPQFAELTYRCDRAMREHLIAKMQLSNEPSQKTVKELEFAEVGLLDCQDYDVMQKRLMQWGLDETDLSLLTLKAAEAKGRDLQFVIENHEIRY